MEQLPLALAAHVVAFAVPGFVEDLTPLKRALPVDSLKTLALVDKSWLGVVRELIAQFQRETLDLQLETASRMEVLDAEVLVLHHGRQVRDLRVSVVKWPLLGEVQDAGWETLLVHLPLLQRLDLSAMSLSSPHVEFILKAAAVCCLNVEALLLPDVEVREHRKAPDVPYTAAIYAALEQWYMKGTRGGLRQLTMPARTSKDFVRSTSDFFRNVAAFCPRVEYLGGFKHLLRDVEHQSHKESWTLALSAWETFNASCTHLREFHWVVVPFCDPFFQAFGTHVKPQLTKLSLGVNTEWSGAEYYDVLGETVSGAAIPELQHALALSGRGHGATDTSAILSGCPALTELVIKLYHVRSTHVLDDLYRNDRNRQGNTWRVASAAIFDDAFCEALAERCPLLARLEIREAVEDYVGLLWPTQTLTDRGLAALARLKYLSSVDLRVVSCSGRGLLQLLNGAALGFTGRRSLQVVAGGDHDKAAKRAFYKALAELLKQLAKTRASELSCVRRGFHLRLRNASQSFVDAQWSGGYLHKLRDLAARVQAAHPALRLRVVAISSRGSRAFRRLEEIALSPSDAEDDCRVFVDPAGGALGF